MISATFVLKGITGLFFVKEKNLSRFPQLTHSTSIIKLRETIFRSFGILKLSAEASPL